MTMTHADAASRLGMAEREVVDVQPTPAGDAVQTHDGTWTLVTSDGLEFNIPAPSAETPVDGGGEDAPPTGSAAVVLAWVDNDPGRAAAALEAECAGGGRAGLMAALEKLAG